MDKGQKCQIEDFLKQKVLASVKLNTILKPKQIDLER